MMKLKRLATMPILAGIIVLLFTAMSASTSSAGTTTYKYDAIGRLVEVDYANGSKILYTYDNAGNCTQVAKSV